MYRNVCWDKTTKGIKLFTWDENGNRIVQEHPFKPYYYIRDDHKLSKDTAWSIFGKRLIKEEFDTPFERSQRIKLLSKEDPETGKPTRRVDLYENLKPAQQFLINHFGGKENNDDFTKFPLKICFFDIETVPLPGDEFPEPESAKAEISLLTIHDSLTDTYTTFGIHEFTGNLPQELKCNYVYCKNEKILLNSFLEYLEDDYPDILSGWNINFFDMPYLVNRIRKVLSEEDLDRLSPIGNFWTTQGKSKDNPPRYYTKYNTDGMQIMDYIDVYKKYKIKLQETYRLDYIGEIEVGQKKLEYEGTIGEFQKRDWNTFVLYNIRDVELLVKIDRKTNYFGLVRFLAYMGLTTFDDSIGTVVYSTGALALIARSRKQRLYTPVRVPLENEKNAGGYVSVNTGFTKDLFTLDFSSLYPNLIRTLNISIDTLFGQYYEPGECDIELKPDSIFVKKFNKGEQYVEKDKLEQTWNKDKFISRAKDNNLILAEGNILFKQDKIGIVPEYMTTLFNKRKDERRQLFEKEKILEDVIKEINARKKNSN